MSLYATQPAGSTSLGKPSRTTSDKNQAEAWATAEATQKPVFVLELQGPDDLMSGVWLPILSIAPDGKKVQF